MPKGTTTKSTTGRGRKASAGDGGTLGAKRTMPQQTQQPQNLATGPANFNKRDITSLTANFRKATESLEAMRGTLSKFGIEIPAQSAA